MRHLLRFVLALLLCTPLLAVQTSSTDAQSAAFNPDAEDYIRNELLLDGSADLASQFPDSADRVVRGEFIVSLWKDPELASIPFFKLSNATITGGVPAEGIAIPFGAFFANCTFEGLINLDGANTKTFRIDDSTVKGILKMGRMNVEGDLALYQTTFESEVTLFDAVVEGNLLAVRSRFLGTPVEGSTSLYPFELWKIHVEQSTEFTGSVIKGKVNADNAEFDVDAKFDEVVFEDAASFRNIQIGVKGDFQKATFKDTVTFESSLIDRDIAFTGATFEDVATFDYISVERFFDFNETTLNKDFSFLYPSVGWPYFAGATFKGPVFFEGIQTDNDLDFTDASYEYIGEPFTIYLSRVGGQGLFNGFKSPAGLILSQNRFDDLEITGTEQTDFQTLGLDATIVNGNLTLDNLRVAQLSARELEVQERTTFARLTVSEMLNLSNAELGFFTIGEQPFWPTPSGGNLNSNLRGMNYSDIGFVTVEESEISAAPEKRKDSPGMDYRDKELGSNNWSVLLGMVDQSEYSPQAYRSLAQYFIEKGHPEWAEEVEFSRQNRERETLTPGSGAWFWSWFSYYFSGYGQKPELALIWSFLVITIGAVLYWKESDLIIIDQDLVKLNYNPFLYSFALFVPFIDLDFAGKWEPKPERRVAWIYKYILKILGWILTPIALLTFGGVLS